MKQMILISLICPKGEGMMTAEEWKKAEEELKCLFNPVKLTCDGYKVTIILVRTDQFKNALAVYVNGEIKGKWYMEDCEERRRFFQSRSQSAFNKKQKDIYKKIRKSTRKEIGIDIEKKFTYYTPYWKSFKALKSHLIKNNTNIELVKEVEM